MRRVLCVFAGVAMLASSMQAASAAGRKSDRVGSCRVSGNVVSATGLPTGEVINFMLTDSSGTRGWVLGLTSDGTWTVTVPDSPATYEFVSRTYGRDGAKYDVFASC
jgi:hypothetical protein